MHLADEQLAVDTLLVTDRLFKAADVVARGRYVALVERVKDHGGKVRRALPATLSRAISRAILRAISTIEGPH